MLSINSQLEKVIEKRLEIKNKPKDKLPAVSFLYHTVTHKLILTTEYFVVAIWFP